MWRLILVTFAFLAVAFYELSGGNDYAPGQHSLQVQGLQMNQPAEVRVAALDVAEPEADAGEAAEVTRAAGTLTDLKVEDDNSFKITLASVSVSNGSDSASTANLPKFERVATSPDVIEAAAVEAAIEAEVATERGQPESVATGFVGEEVFSLETYVMRQNDSYSIPESGASDEVTTSGDLRQVTGNLVNMRAGPGTDFEKVGKLRKGTSIAVLEEPGNGWVMLEVLETGEIGWMADWLITASN